MVDSPLATGMDARSGVTRAQVAAGLVAVALFLAIAGMGVAGYLAFENVQGKASVCGVTHGCSTVQDSKYGKIVGVPVSVPGFLLYVALVAAAVAWLSNVRGLRPLFTLLAFGGVLFGLTFSAYLTYIEAFVLNAWCIFCVVSALIMTALTAVWLAVLWLAVREQRGIPAAG
ncbi:MAG: hypothetical protein Kow0010_24230 [Dehalococcoidia bacterium]